MRGGNAREAGRLHRGVAIPAIDAVVFYMVLVAEGNWLLPGDIRVGVVGGLVDGIK